MKPSHTIRPVFDDPNLVPAAGLVPALRLAESAGFHDLPGGLSVPAASAGAKAASVAGGMLAGADSISSRITEQDTGRIADSEFLLL